MPARLLEKAACSASMAAPSEPVSASAGPAAGSGKFRRYPDQESAPVRSVWRQPRALLNSSATGGELKLCVTEHAHSTTVSQRIRATDH